MLMGITYLIIFIVLPITILVLLAVKFKKARSVLIGFLVSFPMSFLSFALTLDAGLAMIVFILSFLLGVVIYYVVHKTAS